MALYKIIFILSLLFFTRLLYPLFSKLALARLLKFWNLRHKVFGTESYALPMTLDGT